MKSRVNLKIYLKGKLVKEFFKNSDDTLVIEADNENSVSTVVDDYFVKKILSENGYKVLKARFSNG